MTLPYLIALAALATGLLACDKDAEEGPNLPSCIEERIDATSSREPEPVYAVYAQDLDGIMHYWFRDGSAAYDGSEDILTADCDTVCFYGGFIGTPPCLEEFDDEGWVEIWRG